MIDRIADPWGPRTPYGPGDDWPTRVDSFYADGIREEDVDAWYRVASILHSNGDAYDVAVKDGKLVGVRGLATDRINHGRLGPKDLYGWQANASAECPRDRWRRTRARNLRRVLMHLSHQIELLREAERELCSSLRAGAEAHADDPEVAHTTELLADWSDSHVEQLASVSARYGRDAPPAPDALHNELFHGPRQGPIGLLRDLQDLFLQASRCDLSWTLLGQAAQGARDEELLAVVQACERETVRALQWIKTVLKANAVQALVVA